MILIILGMLLGVASPAPKGITYDQKQTGEYNIQLHLKDFQIIAVVGDDSLGALGDYDYNYDYSDFTIKPVTPSTTTPKPTNSNATNSSEPGNNTTKHPLYAILHFTEKPALNSTQNVTGTTVKPLEQTTKTSQASSTNPLIINGQIPVIVHDPLKGDNFELPFLKDSLPDKKADPVTNVAIVPTEDLGGDSELEQPALGEILHYRRCAQGFSRDKRGRCRKVRRPQIPLGITRFASNLAARFRQAASDEPNSTL